MHSDSTEYSEPRFNKLNRLICSNGKDLDRLGDSFKCIACFVQPVLWNELYYLLNENENK